ncbi:MAG TPA: AAA family ATPase, partial [Actinomycetota bacterium]|nr:AAA family ATPase [Actinomycetota bacterium]
MGRRDLESVEVGGRGPDQPAAQAESIFIGRERELAIVIGELDAAVTGSGRLILLSGEPGIGKSRFADELASVARTRGVPVLWGRCWEAGGASAYWPWVQILRGYARTRTVEDLRAEIAEVGADLGQLLPEARDLVAAGGDAIAADPDAARFHLFDATIRFLAAASAREALLLVLEDLHAADVPSMLLLRFLAEQIGEMSVLAIATYRDVEVLPASPLSRTIYELIRLPSTRRLPLARFGHGDVVRYLDAVTDLALEPSAISSLYDRTRGNPLFLAESVRLLASGRDSGTVDIASRELFPIGVREVIARRAGALSDACRRSLALVSVLGTEFGIEPARQLVGLAVEQLLDVLDEAVRSGLLVEAGTIGRFRFSHDLVRETLYDNLPPARRVRAHRAAAEILEKIYGARAEDHLAELAHHFLEAAPGGGAIRAVEYARAAGDLAVRTLAYEEAARLYTMAIQALELVEGEFDATAAVDLLLSLGDAQGRAGDLSSSRKTFLRAAEAARRTGAATQLGVAALGYGGRFVWARSGDDTEMETLLEDALALLGDQDDRLRVRLLGRLSCALRGARDRNRAAALSDRALEMARSQDDPPTLAYALLARFGAIWWPETVDERLRIADELLDVAERSRDPERMIDGHLGRFISLAEASRIPEARGELNTVERMAETLRQPAQRWLVAASRAQLCLLEGEFATAEPLIDDCMRLAPTTLIRDNICAARYQRAQVSREQDRPDEAEEDLRRCIEEF